MSDQAQSRLLSANQFSAAHPAFSGPSLRWLIFKANENGLEQSGAILRIGRKVLIDEPRFLSWARSQSSRAT